MVKVWQHPKVAKVHAGNKAVLFALSNLKRFIPIILIFVIRNGIVLGVKQVFPSVERGIVSELLYKAVYGS